MSAAWKIAIFVTLVQSALISAKCVSAEDSCVNVEDETNLMQLQKNVNSGSKRSVQMPETEESVGIMAQTIPSDPEPEPEPQTSAVAEQAAEQVDRLRNRLLTEQAHEHRIAHESEMIGEANQAAADQSQIHRAEDHGAEMRANEEQSAAVHERAQLRMEEHDEQVARQRAAEERAEAEAAREREQREVAEEEHAAEEQRQEQEQEEAQAAEEAHEEDVHEHPEKYAAQNAYKRASRPIHEAADKKRDFVEEVSKGRHMAAVAAAEKLAAQRQRYAANVKEDQQKVVDDAAERDTIIQEHYNSVKNAKTDWEASVVKKESTEVAAMDGRAKGIKHAVAEEHHEDVEAEEAAIKHHHAVNAEKARMHHAHMKQLKKDVVNRHTQKLGQEEERAVHRAGQAVEQAVEHADRVAGAWNHHFDHQIKVTGHKAEQAVHGYSHGIQHNQEDTNEAVAVR